MASRDLAKAERSRSRRLESQLRVLDAIRAREHEALHGPMVWQEPAAAGGDVGRHISDWSRKSRARMLAALCSLDLRRFVVTERSAPGMVTLTLPGKWVELGITPRRWKQLVRTLRWRYHRAFGHAFDGFWKLEFQRRGAPHTHILMLVPSAPARDGRGFRQWLSEEWADVVGTPDPEERRKHIAAGTGVDIAEGLRLTDPKRAAVYFTKHSSAGFGDKEYQHSVPESWAAAGGPGRFWGYWGLQRSEVVVEVPTADAIASARILRRYARAQGTTRQETVWRSGEGRYRHVRRRVRRMQGSAGFLAVNDGPSFAWQLARFLDLQQTPVDLTLARHAAGRLRPPPNRLEHP